MLQVDSLLSLGLYKIDLWELSEASQLLQQVIDLAQDTKHHAWSEKACLCLALVQSYQGETLQPTEVANKFYQLIIQEKNSQHLDWIWRDGVHKGAGITSSGGNLQRQPLARQPRGTTPRNLAIPLSQYNTGRFAYFIQILGHIFLNLKDNNKAQEIFTTAIAFSQESYYTQIKAKCLMGLAIVARNHNQFNSACSYHESAIKLLDNIGAKCDLATAYYQWGLTLIKMEQEQLYRQACHQAIQLFQQIQAPLQVARVRQSLLYI